MTDPHRTASPPSSSVVSVTVSSPQLSVRSRSPQLACTSVSGSLQTLTALTKEANQTGIAMSPHPLVISPQSMPPPHFSNPTQSGCATPQQRPIQPPSIPGQLYPAQPSSLQSTTPLPVGTLPQVGRNASSPQNSSIPSSITSKVINPSSVAMSDVISVSLPPGAASQPPPRSAHEQSSRPSEIIPPRSLCSNDSSSQNTQPLSDMGREVATPPGFRVSGHSSSGQSSSATTSILNLCQQFLSSHGFQSAADALSELKPQSDLGALSTQSPGRTTSLHPEKTPPILTQFRYFIDWIDYGLECLQDELMEVAFVMFVEIWSVLLKTSNHYSRLLLSEYWDRFSPLHTAQLEEMITVMDARQYDLIMQLRWWKHTQRFHIFISRLGHRLLFEYIGNQDTPQSTSVPSFLYIIQTRIVFHIISRPLSEVDEGLKEDYEVLKPTPQISPGVQPTPVQTTATVPILWGLLAGPFSSVQSLGAVPSRTTPSYMTSDTTPLAYIDGEITLPVDPNHALPLTDESPWVLSRWAEMRRKFSRSAIIGKSLDDFPSVLVHSFSQLPAELSALRMSRLSGRWIAAGRETGAIELWDVCELSQCSEEKPSHADVVMDDHEFGSLKPDDAAVERQQHKRILTPQLLLGHTSSITSLSFVFPAVPSEDHKQHHEHHLLSASSDSTVRIWALDGRHELASINAHQSTIWSVDTSPYGNYFLCGSADRLGSLWEFGRRQPIRLFSGHTSDVEVIKAWPNSILAATGSSDTTVKMWDLRTANQIRFFRRHRCPVTHVAVSPNGRLLASGGTNGPVIVWDVAHSKPLRFVSVPSSITAIEFARGSRFLVIGCSNGEIMMSDIEVASSDKTHYNYRSLPLGLQVPADVSSRYA